jgi:hypothetical protein
MDHVRQVIERSRKKQLRRLQDCAMQSELGVSVSEWLCGKLPFANGLDPAAVLAGRAVLDRVKESLKSSFGMILARPKTYLAYRRWVLPASDTAEAHES